MELLSLMVVLFLVFWEIHTVSHSGCNNLRPHQQRVRVCFSLHPCWHLLFVLFLMMAILTGLRWYIIMVSICIPLETDDIKNLYRCLLYTFSRNLVYCWINFKWETKQQTRKQKPFPFWRNLSFLLSFLFSRPNTPFQPASKTCVDILVVILWMPSSLSASQIWFSICGTESLNNVHTFFLSSSTTRSLSLWSLP